MSLTELAISQISDPFRIGLLLALVLTAYNTAAQVGMAVPLALGVVFVAVLLPATTRASEDAALMPAVLTGLAVNAFVIGVILVAKAGWKRLASGGK